MNPFRFLTAIALVAATAQIQAATVVIIPHVEANAPGAVVTLSTVVTVEDHPKVTPRATNAAPFTLPKSIRLRDVETLRVEAVAPPDYAPYAKDFDFAACKAGVDHKTDGLTIVLPMERIRQSFPVHLGSLSNAKFTVDGNPVSADTILVFNKQGENWPPLTLRAEVPDYEALVKVVSRDDLLRSKSSGRQTVDLDMTGRELLASLTVKIDCNLQNPAVFSGATKIELPASKELNFDFRRERISSEWNHAQIRVLQQGYEWAPAGKIPQEAFEQEFTKADFEQLNGRLALNSFQPFKYVITSLLSYAVENKEVKLGPTNYLASVVDAESGATPVRLVKHPRNARLLLSSLAMPKGGSRIYFAMANYEFNENSQAVAKGSTIYFSEKGTLPSAFTTKSESYDTDPAVSPNGKVVVFSSLVGGTRCIRQVESKGGIAYPVSEDPRYFDTEPTVTDRARLAFTRRQVNAPPGTPPQIYTQMVDENGQPQTKLFGPACDGHSGAWDPDGKRIVFIDPENRLCVVNVEDGRVRPLLDSASYASPSWDSLGKNIYYAADKEQNERGQRQFDLFRVAIGDDGSVAGSPQPLTTNGSLDTCPVISDERGEVYFLSNRGATSYGEDSLAIFSLKMQ